MRPIDMLSACVIGGAGALVSASMMLIARHAGPTLRAPIRFCLWGFLVLAAGLMQNAFTDIDARWPILFGAIASLLGTMLVARGLVWIALQRVPVRGGWPDMTAACALLAATWPLGPYVFGIVFHATWFVVTALLAGSLRHALLAPRSAAERAVAVTLAVFALTWVYGIYTAVENSGPEMRHLMYMPDPMLTVYAVTYALMPLTVGALVLNLANAQLGARLHVQASTDELTGLLSRRALHERAAGWQAAVLARRRLPVLLLVDVDHFKRVNDSHGHECGDSVLRAVAGRMRGQLRTDTLLARYGGEEFLVLLEADTPSDAAAAAERLRSAIAAVPVTLEALRVAVTASVGVAAWPAGSTFEQARAAADHALYAAKRGGRDRIAVSAPDAAPAAVELSAPAAAARRTP